MIMDPYYPELSELVNGFRYYDSSYLPNSDQFLDIGSSGFDQIQNPNFSSDLCNDFKAPSSSNSGISHDSSATSPTDDANGPSDPVLKYINQILMEEKFEEKPCMFYDPLALQQTEEMLNLVIGGADRTQDTGNSTDFGPGNGSSDSGFASSSTDVDNFVDSRLRDPSVDSHCEYNLKSPLLDRVYGVNNGVFESSMNDYLIKNMFSDTDSVLQFQKGLEEASKFLPNGNQLNFDLEADKTFSSAKSEQGSRSVQVKEESEWFRGRKNHEREKTELEETRSSKQAAVHIEDSELTEMFDSVLLLGEKYKPEIELGRSSNAVDENSSKKQGSKNKKTKKKKNRTVDFRTLLILCAQAVSAGDKLTANELLKQIRQQSSPLGDGPQRVAHCFADALEARLARTSCAEIQDYYNSLTGKKTTAADVLKAYQVYLSATPFTSFIYSLAIKMILDVSENAKVVHIVDFGILYGFQWPMLIKMMSKREGGGPPPKLRITGIELPQHGFKTTERIEETGRRLAKYAERFNVPFEYNPIASKNWGTIRMEELKIRRNEILVVNSMHRFKNLHDETAYDEGNNNYCPRDAVLRLIREMNPDLFIHSIINGSYNAPFFLTRFKEALFHFSALFDVFENTIPKDNEERVRFERLFHGREVMNVIASEGTERVERPETYRQWQVRTVRAGFRQVPANRKMIEKFREELKLGYHKDFVIDEDGEWFLQGWKGRILYATTCWVPA